MANVSVRRFNLPVYNLPQSASGFRIAHISDLHMLRWNSLLQSVQDRLCEHDFDILLVTGDYANDPTHHTETAHLLERLLGPIRPPLGIYGVLGNHDDPALATCDLPLTILRDEVRLISVGRFEFYLGGIDQNVQRRGSVTPQLLAQPDDAPLLLMAHYPSTAFELPAGKSHIMFSGHTHGGQIRLPGFGCLYANDRIPRAMARGLHTVHGNWLHVNPGIGVSSFFPARFCCPPEISFLTLRTPQRRRRRHRVKTRRTVSLRV